MIIKCDWCGKEFNKKPFEVARYEHHYCSKQCYGEMFESEYRKSFSENSPQFKLIEYNGKNDVTIECIECGWQYRSDSTNAKGKKFCDNCQQKKVQENRDKREIERQKRLAIGEMKKNLNAKKRELNKQIKALERNYNNILTRDEREERKRQNRRACEKRNSLKRHGRLKTNGRIDKDITLERLYDKEKGQCHICGLLCNYDDYKITEEGYFIVGKFYPSIDHVTPLSKGGTHTWDNIKLAHISCNSWKGNKSRGVL